MGELGAPDLGFQELGPVGASPTDVSASCDHGYGISHLAPCLVQLLPLLKLCLRSSGLEPDQAEGRGSQLSHLAMGGVFPAL